MTASPKTPSSQHSASPRQGTAKVGSPPASDPQIKPGAYKQSRWKLLTVILCLGAIGGVGYLIRVTSHVVISFNPDECDYAVAGAYFANEGLSPFTSPPAYFPYVISFHKTMASTFGPYCVRQIRWVITLVSIVIAGSLFLQSRRLIGAFYACLAAMAFLWINSCQEGFSANREWPSMLFLTLANGLVLWMTRELSVRQRTVISLLAGFVAGLSLYFKEQSVIMAIAPPLYFLVQALTRSWPWRTALRSIAVYAVGGILAGVVYVAPLAWHGTLQEHLRDKSRFGSMYTQGSGVSLKHWFQIQLAGFTSSELFPLLLLGFILACVILVRCLRRRPPQTPLASVFDSSVARLYAIQYLLGLYVVQMGQRFFPHYFLFLLPPLVVLLGLLGYVVERSFQKLIGRLQVQTRMLLQVLYRFSLIAIMLISEPPLIGVQGTPRGPLQQAALKLDLSRFSSPQEKIFVWGWLPDVYVLQRRLPATRFAGCVTLIHDFGRAPDDLTPELKASIDSNLGILLKELEQTKPKVFVDTLSVTYALSGKPEIYSLNRYPTLKAYVDRHYVLKDAGAHGMKIYQRIDAVESGKPATL